eukprot:GHVR01149284.1.p1 GENE.GHVR01149284.1~~GHVR01149284.1.p1  ORF type:complete len:348 (+),score=83.74 GHVR01149284.1:66-1109(+)
MACKRTTCDSESNNDTSTSPHKKIAVSQLSQLKTMTTVVADTGDFDQLKKFQPQDSTTNPTLIYQAASMTEYASLIDNVISECKNMGHTGTDLINEACDCLSVEFGCQILKIVPGVVSTEVDASLSFDTKESINKARKLIKMYESKGYSKDRILIKMASTWEGIQAAKVLEKEGIKCNLTLLFSLCQAVAAAEAGATLISPFVGRILDWHVKNGEKKSYSGAEDPGVLSVAAIYNYYRYHKYNTIVMGASFRNIDEVLALSGCDKLTVSPKLLAELENNTTEFGYDVTRILIPDNTTHVDKISMDETTFRWMLNEDQMATEKLSEGIRNFNKDLDNLRTLIAKKIKN